VHDMDERLFFELEQARGPATYAEDGLSLEQSRAAVAV